MLTVLGHEMRLKETIQRIPVLGMTCQYTEFGLHSAVVGVWAATYDRKITARYALIMTL